MLIVLKYGGNAMAAGGGEDPVLDEGRGACEARRSASCSSMAAARSNDAG